MLKKSIYIIFLDLPPFDEDGERAPSPEVAVMASSAGEAIDLALPHLPLEDDGLLTNTVLIRKMPLVQKNGLSIVGEPH